jgi:hypothetical protein
MTFSEITIEEVANYLKLNYMMLDSSDFALLNSVLDSVRGYVLRQTGQTAAYLDKYAEIVHAVYILCEDCYDTRSYYVDKNSINKIVRNILDMHCVTYI